MKISGIYKITNPFDGKFYIGSAVDCKRRWTKKYNKYLENAFKKYGKKNFIFEVLELVEKEKLVQREQFWLDELKPFVHLGNGYNICCVAGAFYGSRSTEQQRKEHSERMKGSGNPMFGVNRPQEWKDEHSKTMKGKFSGSNNPNFGKTWNKNQKNANKNEGKSGVKLTWKIVDQIKELYSNKIENKLSYVKIGKMFGVSGSTIQAIIEGRSWVK